MSQDSGQIKEQTRLGLGVDKVKPKGWCWTGTPCSYSLDTCICWSFRH